MAGCLRAPNELTGAAQTATPHSWFRPLFTRRKVPTESPARGLTQPNLRLRSTGEPARDSGKTRGFHSGYTYVSPFRDPRGETPHGHKSKRRAAKDEPGTYAPQLAPTNATNVKVSEPDTTGAAQHVEPTTTERFPGRCRRRQATQLGTPNSSMDTI